MVTIRIKAEAFNPTGYFGRFRDLPPHRRKGVVYIIKNNGSGNISMGPAAVGSYNESTGQTYRRGLSSFAMWADIDGMQVTDEQMETIAVSADNNPSPYLAPLILAVERNIVEVIRNNVALTTDQIRNFTA